MRMAEILEYYGGDDYYQLAALLHDAEEAYLPDIPRPVKHMMPEAEKIYKPIREAIFRKFGLTGMFDWSVIKDFDNRLLFTEAKILGVWNRYWASLGRKLRYYGEDSELGWSTTNTQLMFERKFEEINGRIQKC